MFTGAGWWLDRRFGTFPVLMVLGAGLGAVLSTISVWRSLQTGLGDSRDSGGTKDD